MWRITGIVCVCVCRCQMGVCVSPARVTWPAGRDGGVSDSWQHERHTNTSNPRTNTPKLTRCFPMRLAIIQCIKNVTSRICGSLTDEIVRQSLKKHLMDSWDETPHIHWLQSRRTRAAAATANSDPNSGSERHKRWDKDGTNVYCDLDK